MRWIVGLFLIAAAFLKAFELYLYPSSVLADNFSQLLKPLLIGGEFGLGLFAFTGLYWRQLRSLAMILFAGFASYSLLLALQGEASCGCFGPVDINPRWTFLLDVTVFAGLTLECLTKRNSQSTSGDLTKLQVTALLPGIILTSLIVTFGLAWHVASRQTTSEDGFRAVGDLVILEPETWVGQDFPLLEYVDIEVSQGNWVLLMHRHDCPECQEAIPKYEQLAMFGSNYQIAIIEVPPHDTSHETQSSPCNVGRLSDLRVWFVETPVEIQLEGGIVKSASTDLPFLNKAQVNEN